MPSDITGTECCKKTVPPAARRHSNTCRAGIHEGCWPDEINRTPPRRRKRPCSKRCKSGKSRAGGHRHPAPRSVLRLRAHPIEQEREPIRCPEAQLDSFLFKIFGGTRPPTKKRQIYRRTTGVSTGEVRRF